MKFAEPYHQKRLEKILKYAKSEEMIITPKYEAVCYLLTANERVWEKAEIAITPEVNLDYIDMQDIGIVGYVMIKCASDLFYDTNYVTLYDIAYTEELTPALKMAIITALEICQKGYKSRKTSKAG